MTLLVDSVLRYHDGGAAPWLLTFGPLNWTELMAEKRPGPRAITESDGKKTVVVTGALK